MSDLLEPHAPRPRLGFDGFELDPASGDLFAGGDRVPLAPQPLAVLGVLVARAGETVTREALRAEVWGAERHVQFEQSLNSCMRRLRAALGDDPLAPRFIETVPRRGYRFVAPVAAVGVAHADRGAGERPRTSRRRLVLAAVLAALATLAIVVGKRAAERAATTRPPLSSPAAGTPVPTAVAVLPFADRTGDRAWGFLASELAAGLRQQLRAYAHDRLRVLGAATSEALARGDAGPPHLAVRGVLEHDGAGGSLRLEQLDDDGVAVWQSASSWTGALAVAPAERALAEVAAALAAHLLGAAEPPLPADDARPNAREALLRGRYQMHRGGADDVARAIASFEQATVSEPGYALAWAELSRARSALAWPRGAGDPERIAAARRAAERALAIDPSVAEAHLALGYIQLFDDWAPAEAEASFHRAATLAPHSSAPHSGRAAALAALGRTDEAVAASRLAEALDPLDMVVRSDLCWYLLYDDRVGDAAGTCRRAFEVAPDNRWLHFGLALALAEIDPRAAVDLWLDTLADTPAPLDRWRAATAAEAPSTLRSIAAWLADRQHEAAGGGAVPSLGVAAFEALAGRVDPAFAWLERALDERQAFMVFLGSDPRFDPVRGDPRFAALVARVAPRSASGQPPVSLR